MAGERGQAAGGRGKWSAAFRPQKRAACMDHRESSSRNRRTEKRVRLPLPVRHERGEGRGEGCPIPAHRVTMADLLLSPTLLRNSLRQSWIPWQFEVKAPEDGRFVGEGRVSDFCSRFPISLAPGFSRVSGTANRHNRFGRDYAAGARPSGRRSVNTGCGGRISRLLF